METSTPPAEDDKKPESTDKPAEEGAPAAAAETPLAKKPSKKFLSTPIIIGIIAVLVIGGGAYAYMSMSGDDDSTATPAASVEEDTPAGAEEASEIPAGYKRFEDETSRITFLYPESWGNATLKQGEEERMGHLTAGSQKVVIFSNNATIVGGIMSNDWTHDPDMGHGGVGEPGAKTLADAKDAKNHTNAANVYVDTTDQFAYVGYCADNCTSDSPRTQIVFTASIDANTDYEVIQFIQAGDALPAEYYTDGLVDYTELDSADLSPLFPKTDPRFVELQKLADSVEGI